ncbi:hypothetical protein H9X86_07215 [Pseudoflavonifractor capillosus]|uniref:hypothetical protein n=1 Tax=Pseudoflavonifractor capillosus TaxID=106588 RepID=UPI00195C78D6|nr:hypothetical protein [Pseudoflavonifractor capillosus]MBM6897158.1 hypothetical protein [Pseudoflavonifractor capillosus]
MSPVVSLTFSLLCLLGAASGNSVAAPTTQFPDYSFNSFYNEEASQKIHPQSNAKLRNSLTNTTTGNLVIDLYKGDSQKIQLNGQSHLTESYTSTGTIRMQGDNVSFSAEGTLLNVPINSNTEGLIGNLFGTTDKEEFLVITLHSIPETEELFAYVSVGTVSENSTSEVLIFGDTFNEMNLLVERLYLWQNNTSLAPENSGSYDIEKISENPAPHANTNSAYNTVWRQTLNSETTSKNGRKYKIASLSLFSPKKVRANSVYDYAAKINANMEVAKKYALEEYGLTHVAVTPVRGSVQLRLNFPDADLSNPTPEPYVNIASLTIPVKDKFGICEWLPLEASIELSGIKITRSSTGTSGHLNVMTWNHAYSTDVDIGSQSGEFVAKGYYGRADGCCKKVPAGGTGTATIWAKGQITFHCYASAALNGVAYSGTYTVSVGDISQGVTVEGY